MRLDKRTYRYMTFVENFHDKRHFVYLRQDFTLKKNKEDKLVEEKNKPNIGNELEDIKEEEMDKVAGGIILYHGPRPGQPPTEPSEPSTP